jgi:hypothetical protein
VSRLNFFKNRKVAAIIALIMIAAAVLYGATAP